MGVKEKRLLILGAGRGQIGLYKAAKAMGIITIAGTMPHYHQKCIDLADEICYMDISDPEDVSAKAKKLNVDGVATCCLDTGIISLGKACDMMGLTGLSEEAALICGDKNKMKKAFMEHGVTTAKYFKIDNEQGISIALENLTMPVVVKATDLQGSCGIYIARTIEEVYSSFYSVMKLTKKNYCLIEEFIEGVEFGAQAFVYNHEILFVMPHGDETYTRHTAVPVGHYVPLEAEGLIIKKIEVEVRKAIHAVGLNNCAVNVDMIVKDNQIFLIELTGRVGANCLPELVEINYGVEYYKMIATLALGENPIPLWNCRSENTSAGLARMILSEDKSGIIKEIYYDGDMLEEIKDITFFKGVGDKVNAFENSSDCIGQVIVQERNLNKCTEKIEQIISKIKISGLQ